MGEAAMPRIDGSRLLKDLRRVAEFGAYKTGVHRPTYSPQDVEARTWVADRLREAGLDPVIDGIGNVIGRSSAKRRLLLGSHIESQNYAGWLDGILGVIYGLEVARAFRETPGCEDMGIEVGAWADEEGHYGNFFGSRSFIGQLEEGDIDKSRNRTDGTPLRDALQNAGYAGRPRELIDPSRYVGYLEAHIEQGDYLESTGLQIGVVTSIVAIWQYRITFTGVQNHAGTTRMAIRKDAGLAAVKLASEIDRRFPGVAGERSVWTVGRITLDPGAPSIVPGGAEMLFQFRDADRSRLEILEKTLEEIVATADASGPCGAKLEVISRSEPVLMDAGFQDALDTAARQHAPSKSMRMPSAAGHDAQLLALKIPAGMLFVPSIGGISHHWTENTNDEDIVLGCQTLATGARLILGD